MHDPSIHKLLCSVFPVYHYSIAVCNMQKGKGKGKIVSVQSTPEEDFQQRLREAVPDQVKAHTATKLLESEWSVPTCVWPNFRAGFVCVCPKDNIPDLIQKLGYTTVPSAILTVQSPGELSTALRGYRSTQVYCTLIVHNGEELEEIMAYRHLVQLGWGAEVKFHFDAEADVAEEQYMEKVVLNFPETFDWQHEGIKPLVVHQQLSQHIPAHSYEGITCRHNGSATVWVHHNFTEALFKASGAGGMFSMLASPMPLPLGGLRWNSCGLMSVLRLKRPWKHSPHMRLLLASRAPMGNRACGWLFAFATRRLTL
eukprot:2242789-Amphidinium_carterae.1